VGDTKGLALARILHVQSLLRNLMKEILQYILALFATSSKKSNALNVGRVSVKSIVKDMN
jgi:hypothetical protein